jgi:hypothetical protein
MGPLVGPAVEAGGSLPISALRKWELPSPQSSRSSARPLTDALNTTTIFIVLAPRTISNESAATGCPAGTS